MRIRQTTSYYEPAQILRYLQHIRYPDSPSEEDVQLGDFPRTLQTLGLLMRLHLLTFPFENTAMHYSAEHFMDVTPEGLFNRLVQSGNGYGSYCFGQNGLFLGILRGLGFRVFAAPGRVNFAPPSSKEVQLTTNSHMVLLVQSDALEDTYVVDVGFGTGLVRPIPLREGAIVPGSASPEEHRITRRRHPQTALEPEPLSRASEPDWCLEMRCGSRIKDWRLVYQFACIETFHEDREAMSFALGRAEAIGAPFYRNVLVISHIIVDEDGTGSARHDCNAPLGRLVMMGSRVDKRIGDRNESVMAIQTDMERLRALKTLFGLHIPETDAVHIVGRPPQLG